jgi:hypothetical protein
MLPLSHVLSYFPILMLFLLHLQINRHTYFNHTKSDFINFCCYELNSSLSLHLLFKFPPTINNMALNTREDCMEFFKVPTCGIFFL